MPRVTRWLPIRTRKERMSSESKFGELFLMPRNTQNASSLGLSPMQPPDFLTSCLLWPSDSQLIISPPMYFQGLKSYKTWSPPSTAILPLGTVCSSSWVSSVLRFFRASRNTHGKRSATTFNTTCEWTLPVPSSPWKPRITTSDRPGKSCRCYQAT